MNEFEPSISTMPNAGIFKRFVAGVIDLVLSIFLSSLISFGISYIPNISNAASFMLFFLIGVPVLFFAYQTISVSLFGFTLGKRLLDIKVVDKSGNKPSFGTELSREVFYKFVSIIPAGIPYLAAFFKDGVTTWYDDNTNTNVVMTHKSQGTKTINNKLKMTIPFVFLVALCGFFEFQFLWGLAYGYQFLHAIPCYFQDGELIGTTTHFKIYLESGDVEIANVDNFKQIIEQAFDYSFWLTSPISEKTGVIVLCLYQNNNNYSQIATSEGIKFDTSGFFQANAQTVHISPEVTVETSSDQAGTLYHEINHFIFFTLLLDNNYNFIDQEPPYFREGFAELVRHSYLNDGLTLESIKAEVRGHEFGWSSISQLDLQNGKIDTQIYYDQSFLVARFLEEKYGQDIFSKIIQSAVKNNIPLDNAIEQSTGSNVVSLEKEWLIWLKQ